MQIKDEFLTPNHIISIFETEEYYYITISPKGGFYTLSSIEVFNIPEEFFEITKGKGIILGYNDVPLFEEILLHKILEKKDLYSWIGRELLIGEIFFVVLILYSKFETKYKKYQVIDLQDLKDILKFPNNSKINLTYIPPDFDKEFILRIGYQPDTGLVKHKNLIDIYNISDELPKDKEKFFYEPFRIKSFKGEQKELYKKISEVIKNEQEIADLIKNYNRRISKSKKGGKS